MDAIKLQQTAHRLWKKRIPVIPGLIKRWIHFCYNSDLSPVTEVGGVQDSATAVLVSWLIAEQK